MTIDTSSPALTVKSAAVVKSRPSSSMSETMVTMSGPAIARRLPSSRRLTHGTIEP
jgi:hypothetical protein